MKRGGVLVPLLLVAAEAFSFFSVLFFLMFSCFFFLGIFPVVARAVGGEGRECEKASGNVEDNEPFEPGDVRRDVRRDVRIMKGRGKGHNSNARCPSHEFQPRF